MGFKANASSQGALKQAKIRRENFAQKNIQQRRQQNNNTDASTSSSTQQQQQQQKPLSEQEQIMRLAPPTIDQAKFLLQNVIESILIPKASEDLRRLFLTWAFNVQQQQQESVDDKNNQNSASRRRQRDTEEKQDINRWTEISSVLKSLVENKSNLRAFVVDDLASSVICALLRAGEKHIERNQQQQQEEEFIGYVQQMIQLLDESTVGFRSDGADDDDNNNTDAAAAEEDDDDESSGIAALSKHHVGRRIVCALLEAGNSSLRKRLNKILAARTLELINHRHGSVCLIRLLELYPKAAKTITPAALDNLQSYLSNPVSERVCEAMVAPSSAVTVLRAILDQVKSIDDKINAEKNENADDEKISSGFSKFVSGNKRNLRFLSRVLNDGFGKISSDDEKEVDATTKQAIVSVLGELVEKAKPLIIDMCFDERGNFFVQSLVRAVGAVNDKTLSQTLVKMILQSSSTATGTTGTTTTASVSELLMNQHAVYVIIALGTVGGSVMSNETTNVLRPHLAKLVLHQHGSLAVRKFIENSTASAEKIYEMLTTTATGGESSSLIPQMITNEYGNMVVQSLLRTVSQPKRLEFFKKYLASSASNNKLVEYSQHPFASRVIFLLVEEKNSKLLDAATHQAIFVALKPHILELAQHLNGRYIIEQLVVPHREVKEILATNFLHLAGAKGSQPVLVKLYESSDAAVRARLANLVCTNLSDLSTNQASSITIQKLLQSDVQRSKTNMTSSSSLEILEGVRKLLGLDTKTGAETSSSASNALLQRLRGDFFGRFVVSLAQGQEMSNSTHNSNKNKH